MSSRTGRGWLCREPDKALYLKIPLLRGFLEWLSMFSGLSFLGLGVQPPIAEWGAMVSDGVLNFNYWWISTFPGLAIFSVAVGANFVGDGLRDALDPRMRR